MKVEARGDNSDDAPRTRLRVLIVEDSEDDARLLLRELARAGYDTASQRVDTPEAMRRVLADNGSCDVVLSNWRMPRFSAIEALKILREAGSEAPFIIVAGKVGEEAAVEAMRAGAHDYVMKGNLRRLGATVERGLREAEVRRERRRAEDERDRVFEFSLDLLAIAGLDGYLRRVNPAFEDTLGYSSEELLARPFIEFVHPEDRAATMSELESLRRGVRTVYFENRYLRKDGSQVWLEWKAIPVLEEDLIYATAREVTERKQAEEALAESSRRIENILGSISEDFYAVDREWRFTYCNERILNAIQRARDGVPERDELFGKNMWEVFPELVGTEFYRKYHEAMREQKTVHVEGYSPLRDQWVEAHAYPSEDGLSVYIRDITERKRVEERLAYHARLLENVHDAVIATDENLLVTAWNKGAEEMYGWRADEVLGRNVWDVVPTDLSEEQRADALKELEARGRFLNESITRGKDGTPVCIEGITIALREEAEDEITGYVNIRRDVTERKRAEQALRRRDAILSAVAFAAERFLKVAVSWEESIAEALEQLGRAARVSRVYIFENYAGVDGEVWTTQRYEWVAEGVSSQMDNPLMQALPYRAAGYGRWMEMLRRGEPVYGHTRDFPAGEQAELREQDILSIAIVPILVEGEWWGFIGFDECKREREWPAAAIDALITAADTLGATIQRERSEEAIRQSEQLYRTVIEQATEYICLVDGETRRFVGSNPAFREALGYTEEELRHMTLYDIIAHDRESIDRNARQIVERGSYFLGERKHRRKDGSLMDVEVSASTVIYNGRQVACIVGHDVTERVEALRLLEERVTALARVSASLTVGQTMEAALDALAARVVQSTAAVACSIVLLDEETGLPRTAGSHGLPEGYTLGMQAAYKAGLRPAAIEVFRTHRPMIVRDVRQIALEQPLASSVHRFFRNVAWDTVYCVPLVYRGQALGTLNLYYLAGEEPGEDEKVFLGAVADQTAVAVENAGLFAAAQGKAALEERQRLARELHDSISQALYGIALGARTARALLGRERPPDGVDEWLDYVLSLAEAGMTEMRALIFELRPESLETEGLIAALKQQAAALEARHEIPVNTTLGEEPDLPLQTKETLYRIAQEALHNTLKHARASRADLKLECDARGIILEVSDDGAGFDPGEDFSGHLGLKSMRERAARLGGTLQVESAPGEGTSIRVRIPSGT